MRMLGEEELVVMAIAGIGVLVGSSRERTEMALVGEAAVACQAIKGAVDVDVVATMVVDIKMMSPNRLAIEIEVELRELIEAEATAVITKEATTTEMVVEIIIIPIETETTTKK